MTAPSRFLLYSMSIALALSALGLILGMLYDLYVVFIRHARLEAVLGASIPYYKTVGGLGIVGMIFFFMFLLSAVAQKKNGKPRE
jgi:ABC-type amino acid transport system permease subunit